MIIYNLIIKDQDFKSPLGYNLTNMHSNLESIACNNEQTYILVNHFEESYTIFNYDKRLFSLLGNDFNKADKDLFYKSLNNEISFRIQKYINIANFNFTNKKEDDKCYYFVINFEYGDYGSEIGLSLKLVPILYTDNKCLYATLCMLKKSKHVGKVTLEKYNASNEQVYIYDDTLQRFLEEKEFELTKEEIEVLTLSGEGKKEKEIANELNVSLSRVKLLKNTTFDKLKVKSISEAIFIAYKKGIMK
ncbi:MAG: response regulator transcription factor, partial [Bacteroidales bacterium]